MGTALILGVTGQDGSFLAEFLLKKGYKVIGCKRRTSLIATDRIDHLLNHSRFHLRFYDCLDFYSLANLIEEYNPDEVYNLAAQSHVRVSFDVPENTVDTIVKGTMNLLNVLRLLDKKKKIKVYQASSSEMFGDNPKNPQNETTRFMPASPYACAKVFAHHLCRNYRESYGMFISCGILFNHESERRGETFVTKKITKATARIKLGLQDKLELGNLASKRDWGYAGDYVRAMWMMLQHHTPDDFVIATGESYSVREFLDKTFEVAKLDPDKYVTINPRLFRAQEVPLLLGDASKAREILNWKPEKTLDDIIKTMYYYDLSVESQSNWKPCAGDKEIRKED